MGYYTEQREAEWVQVPHCILMPPLPTLTSSILEAGESAVPARNTYIHFVPPLPRGPLHGVTLEVTLADFPVSNLSSTRIIRVVLRLVYDSYFPWCMLRLVLHPSVFYSYIRRLVLVQVNFYYYICVTS